MRKSTFLLILLLMFPTVAEASTQKFNFTMQNNTALNFENNSYIIEVIEIYRPMYVKVNLTSSGLSRINTLFDDEPITFNEIKLSSSSITNTEAVITIEFPAGWSYPKKYQIVRPVAPVGIPNIILTKSVDKTNISIGDVVEFKITMENKGNATAYNLTLIESLSTGFSINTGSRLPSVINTDLVAGARQEFYYALKAVDAGNFTIEPTKVKYDSKTNMSNLLNITVAAAVQEKSKLITNISVDKNNVTIGDLIKVTVRISNDGKASAKFVRVDFILPMGMEVVEENLRIDDNIYPGMPVERRITLKAIEAGNYAINLRTVYNDDPIGNNSNSEPITVAEKKQNYLYILVPIIIIIIAIALFTMKRHKEYSY